MPKFKVTIEETAVYKIEVEADDEDAAGDAAEEAFVQNESREEQYFSHVEEREVVDVEKL